MSDQEFNNIVSISSGNNNNVFQEITISNETNEFDTKDRFVIENLMGNKEYIIKVSAGTKSKSNPDYLLGDPSEDVRIFLPEENCGKPRNLIVETTTTTPTPMPLNDVQVQQCKDEQVKLLKEKLKIEKIIGFYKIKEVMEHAKRAGYNIKNSDPEYQPFQNKHI